MTAWYVTAMGDVYANALRGQGFSDEVDAIIAANPKPLPTAGVVPDAARGNGWFR